MANRFWVGSGSANTWADTAPTNWSATSGGSNNASVPGATDDVFFDGNSGSGNSVIGADISIKTLDCTSYAGTITHNTFVILTIAGNTFKFVAGMTYTLSSTDQVIKFTSTSGTTAITTAGKTMASFILDGVGGTFQLQDNYSGVGTASTDGITLTHGTFDANNKNITTPSVNSGNTNTRTLTMGSGTWTLTGNNNIVWSFSDLTNLTLNQGNPIVLNYSGSTGTRSIHHGATGGTESNAVSFNITAGSDDIQMVNFDVVKNLNFTGFTGTFTNTSGNFIYGNLTLGINMTVPANTNVLTFATTSGTKTITSNGVTMDLPITFDGVGGTWQLQDAMTVGTTRTVTLTNGTLDANNNNFTMGLFSSTNSNTRVITMGSGTWNLTRAATATVWNMATSSGATINPGTSTIKISGSTTSTRTFAGGGLTYGDIWFSNATNAGQLNFTGSNTFSNIKAGVEGNAQTIRFTAATTTSFSSWSISGRASNLITIGSITNASHTLTKLGGGFICADYLSISRSTFSPSSPVAGYAGNNSTNGGNNSGWSFKSCLAGDFFLCFQ